jgi:hypothetical protein
LLLPVAGIPHKAWNHQNEVAVNVSLTKRHLPCTVQASIQGSPVFESIGPMPAILNAWVRSERGVPCLQPCEIAKAKGMPGEWTMKEATWKNAWIKESMRLHIWTAALDAVGEWMEETPMESSTRGDNPEVNSPTPNFGISKTTNRQDARLKTSEAYPEWRWQVPPDLEPVGAWYNGRVQNL